MTIPAYTNDGILPPFLGSNPGNDSGLMSPYQVTVSEIVARFAVSQQRILILRGWLEHRTELRALGFTNGFQWLDGSFVEDKIPRDLDVVTFVYFGIPSFPDTDTAWQQYARHSHLFERVAIKTAFALDAFFIDLLDPPELIVDTARYFLGLFSHQRRTMVWKGMLQVRLEESGEDAAALLELAAREAALPLDLPASAIAMPLFEDGGPADAS